MLISLFLFLPYTLLLHFGQCLQAISHLKLFPWVNSVKTIHGFIPSWCSLQSKALLLAWTTACVLLILLLLLVFALNSQQDLNINLLAILLGAGVLHLWAWVSGGAYKNWRLHVLEGSFALNLTMLPAATYYVKLSKGNKLCSWVHFCHHSIWKIFLNSQLPHLPAIDTLSCGWSYLSWTQRSTNWIPSKL